MLWIGPLFTRLLPGWHPATKGREVVNYQLKSKEFQDRTSVCLAIELFDDFPALPRRDIPTILRGQLTLLRMRAERDIPVSVDCLARAEELARSLECS